jgi:hypothetical protein
MALASTVAGTYQYAEASIPSTMVVEGSGDCTPSYKLEVEYAGSYLLLSTWLEAVDTIFTMSGTQRTAEFWFDGLTAELYYKISDHDMNILINSGEFADQMTGETVFSFKVSAIIAGSSTQGAAADMAGNLESHVFALVLIDSATADACATNQPYLTQQR